MKTILLLLCVTVLMTGCNILASDGLPTLGKATTIEQEWRGKDSSLAATTRASQVK